MYVCITEITAIFLRECQAITVEFSVDFYWLSTTEMKVVYESCGCIVDQKGVVCHMILSAKKQTTRRKTE